MKDLIAMIQPIEGGDDRYWRNRVLEGNDAERAKMAQDFGQIILGGRDRSEPHPFRQLVAAWLPVDLSRQVRQKFGPSNRRNGFRFIESDKALLVDIPADKADRSGRTVLVTIVGPSETSLEEIRAEYRWVCKEMLWPTSDVGLAQLSAVFDARERNKSPKALRAIAGLLAMVILAILVNYLCRRQPTPPNPEPPLPPTSPK